MWSAYLADDLDALNTYISSKLTGSTSGVSFTDSENNVTVYYGGATVSDIGIVWSRDPFVDASSTSTLVAYLMSAPPKKEAPVYYPPVVSVTFNTGDGCSINPEYLYMFGKTQAPPNPDKDGYRFIGWYKDALMTTPFDFNEAITSNTTVYAKWAQHVALVYTLNQTDFSVVKGTETEQKQSMDTAPVVVENRTFLPIRYVVETLGGKVVWDGAEQKVTIQKDGVVIELWIGKSTALINGAKTPLYKENSLISPFISGTGRTMLPLRFIAEALGCTVDWDGVTQRITVTY